MKKSTPTSMYISNKTVNKFLVEVGWTGVGCDEDDKSGKRTLPNWSQSTPDYRIEMERDENVL